MPYTCELSEAGGVSLAMSVSLGDALLDLCVHSAGHQAQGTCSERGCVAKAVFWCGFKYCLTGSRFIIPSSYPS